MAKHAATTPDLTPSLVRTAVPFIVGALGSWLTRQGLDVNDDLLSAALVPAFGYTYYVGARLLEVYGGPRWRYILGGSKLPVYTEPPAIVLGAEQARVVK